MAVEFLQNYFSAYQKVNAGREESIKARVQCASYCTIVIPLLFGIIYGIACALSLIRNRFSKGSSNSTALKTNTASTTINPVSTQSKVVDHVPSFRSFEQLVLDDDLEKERGLFAHKTLTILLTKYENASTIMDDHQMQKIKSDPRSRSSFYEKQIPLVKAFIHDGYFDMAKTLIDKMTYEIDQYLKQPNPDNNLFNTTTKELTKLTKQIKQVSSPISINNNYVYELHLQTLINMIKLEIFLKVPCESTIKKISEFNIKNKDNKILHLKLEACLACLVKAEDRQCENIPQADIAALTKAAREVIKKLPLSERFSLNALLNKAITENQDRKERRRIILS
jgi:hypothetical protein